MVKFSKDGSDATSGAVRVSRAYTGRDLVGICGGQPFFSVDDWFIGTTPMSAGIPQATRDLTVTFRYNDIESVEQLFDEHPGQLACLILEPEKYDAPEDGFLHKLRDLCDRHGTVLIFDEMITGFRWHLGGAQAFYGCRSRPERLGQGHGERLQRLGTGRQEGDHGAGRAAARQGACVSPLRHPRGRDPRTRGGHRHDEGVPGGARDRDPVEAGTATGGRTPSARSPTRTSGTTYSSSGLRAAWSTGRRTRRVRRPSRFAPCSSRRS